VLVLFAVLAVSVSAEKLTPIEKVLEMLNSMLKTCEVEAQGEAAAFASFDQWCLDTSAAKERSIKLYNEQIEQLTADIGKYEAAIADLTNQIEALDMDIASWESDVKDIKALRKEEKASYELTHQDYSESISALERAIMVLKKQQYSRVQASLTQLTEMKSIPAHAKQAITAFLATDDNTSGFLDYQAPEANAYEFGSGGIVDMLEKLKTKFVDELKALEKEEMQAQHAFEMLHQDLDDQIETAKEDRSRATLAKADNEQALAQAKSDLEQATTARDADQKFLDDMRIMCHTKREEYQERKALRAEEMDAIKKGIELVSNVQPFAQKHLPNLIQKQHSAMLQLSMVTSHAHQNVQERVAKFLREQADKLNSRILMQVAQKAQDDPFKKVKEMIKELIVRLLEQANEEAEHKGWCDTELATNEQTRNRLSQELEELNAVIDRLTAEIAKLTEEIADLQSALAELEASMKEATETRKKEHAENTETIKGAQDGQNAVAQAITFLEEFYHRQGAKLGFELIQQTPEEEAPETWNTPFHGQNIAAGGVVAMLEVIQSDFARLESETRAAEDQAQTEYEQFMHDSEIDKTAKSKDVEYKSYQKEQAEGKLNDAVQDRDATQKEYEAALAYYEKLKPSCVDAGVSYEDRVARRKEEIESLQEALRILNGDEIA